MRREDRRFDDHQPDHHPDHDDDHHHEHHIHDDRYLIKDDLKKMRWKDRRSRFPLKGRHLRHNLMLLSDYELIMMMMMMMMTSMMITIIKMLSRAQPDQLP